MPNVTIDTRAPTLSVDSGLLRYTEDSGTTPIAPAAVVTDFNWNGGSCETQIASNASAQDELRISGSTGLGVSGGNLLDGAVALGTVNVATGAVLC